MGVFWVRVAPFWATNSVGISGFCSHSFSFALSAGSGPLEVSIRSVALGVSAMDANVRGGEPALDLGLLLWFGSDSLGQRGSAHLDQGRTPVALALCGHEQCGERIDVCSCRSDTLCRPAGFAA